MDSQNTKRVFEDACDDLEKLTIERADLDVRILQLKKMVVALAPLIDRQPAYLEDFMRNIEEAGITQNCREVLRGTNNALTPVEVRNQLESIGHKFRTRNPLALIHAVLKRLVENGEVSKKTTEEGDVAYQWILRFPRFRRRRHHRKKRAILDDNKPVTENP